MEIDLSQAVADFENLPVTIKARVRDVFKRLERWPSVSGVKRLRGELSGYFRVRTGDYRVVFAVEEDVIVVVRIGHRSEIYEE